MYEALDFDEGGAQYLPFAQDLLRRLKEVLHSTGMQAGRKHLTTPDGSGRIYIRTRRGPGAPGSNDEWCDYIKIEAGVPNGYILQLVGLGASIPNSKAVARVPFRGNKTVQPFPGFNSIQLSSQLAPGDNIVTAARSTEVNLYGALRKTVFTAFPAQGGAGNFIGAFRHRYVEDGQLKFRTLAVTYNGALVDTEAGLTLAVSGDAVVGGVGAPNPDPVTWVANRNGTAVIVEFSLWPENPPTRNAFRLAVDFAADQKVTATKLTDSTPYGTQTNTGAHSKTVTGVGGNWDSVDSHLTRTVRTATYPAIPGVTSEGLLSFITFSEDSATELLDLYDEHRHDATTGLTLYETYLFTETTNMVVQLPGGISAAFPLAATVTGWSGEYDDGSVTLDWSRTFTVGRFAVLYADPTVPILFYVRHRTIVNDSGLGSGAAGASVAPGTGTVTWVRDVGVLFGDSHRVLFTESATPVSLAGGAVHTKFGFASAQTLAGVFDPYVFPAIGIGSFAPPSSSSSGGVTETPIATNAGYTKKLKWITDPASNTPLNGGGLFARDVSDLTGAWANEHRYWVSVNDVDDWLFGVMKKRDVDGNTINTLDLYAGNLDEPKLRQHYIDYLLAAAIEQGTDQGLIDALMAGGYGAYSVDLSNTSRLALV